MIESDLAQLVRGWLETWHIRQDTAVIQWLLTTLGEIHPDQITLTGIGSLLYGLIVGTQGVGLWIAEPWAITMTVYGLSAFIPLEVYELLHRLTSVKIGILIVNILIVGYLWKQYYRSPSKGTIDSTVANARPPAIWARYSENAPASSSRSVSPKLPDASSRSPQARICRSAST